MAVAEILVPFILSWEGGFSDNINDRGGPTNKGITFKTYESVFGSGVTVSDLRRISDEQWMHVFKIYVWNMWKADEIISQSLANILVDWIWASGNGVIKIVQGLLGLKQDGIVGEKTVSAINGEDMEDLFGEIMTLRKIYINNIVDRSVRAYENKIGREATPEEKMEKTQMQFRSGWMNRINSIGFGFLRLRDGNIINFKD